MPSHTSHKLQPCDVAAFGPLKVAYRDQVEQMDRGGVGTIGKQHFTYLYKPARETALTKRNILAAWRGSGLFTFNPDRVPADTPKPPAELTIPRAESVESPQYESMPTPATPVSAESLASLLNMIKLIPNDDAKRKERLQQKVSNAALTFLAKNALLDEQNKFLTEINNEGKTRRATKSTILGTAKVMTWDDLEKARAEHAAKEAKKAETKAKAAKKAAKEVKNIEEATVGKTKRGRKWKSAIEGDAPGPKAARTDEVQYRVPVAKMY